MARLTKSVFDFFKILILIIGITFVTLGIMQEIIKAVHGIH